MEENQSQTNSIFGMEMDSYAQDHLKTISKWSRFISMTGFILGGIFLLILLVAGATLIRQIDRVMPIAGAAGVVVAILIVVCGLCGTWLYFLLQSSNLIRKGIGTTNSVYIGEGFKAMRSFFIISIVLSLLSILSAFYTILNY
ncbi:MAG: hypothetical protein ABI480_17275 [Chitinophagaceae bacterium]